MAEQRKKRRKFTAEKIAEIVAEAKATTVLKAADHHNVGTSQIYKWMGLKKQPMRQTAAAAKAATPLKHGIAFRRVSLKPEQMTHLKVRHMSTIYDGLYEQIKELRVPGDIETGAGDWIEVKVATEKKIRTLKSAVWKFAREHGLPRLWVLTDVTLAEPICYIALQTDLGAPDDRGRRTPRHLRE